MELTEHGVAIVFAERHKDDLRYCHTAGGLVHLDRHALVPGRNQTGLHLGQTAGCLPEP